jgi:hypothetical protein
MKGSTPKNQPGRAASVRCSKNPEKWDILGNGRWAGARESHEKIVVLGLPEDGEREHFGNQEKERPRRIAHNFGWGMMRMPTTLRADLDIVSEDESEDEENKSQGEHWRRPYRSRNWLSRVCHLTWTGANGKQLPPVGQSCLILTGDAGKDVGKIGLEIWQTKSMTSIMWIDDVTGEASQVCDP